MTIQNVSTGPAIEKKSFNTTLAIRAVVRLVDRPVVIVEDGLPVLVGEAALAVLPAGGPHPAVLAQRVLRCH